MFVKPSKLKIISLLAVVIVITSLASCRKNKNNSSINYEYGVEISSDQVSAQHLLFSLSSTFLKVVYDSSIYENTYVMIDGARAYYTPDSANQFFLYYPPWGNDDGYGNWRQGFIRIKADSGFFNEQFPAQMTFENFNLTKDTITADNFQFTFIGSYNESDGFRLEVDSCRRCFEDTTGIISFSATQNLSVFKSDSLLNPESFFMGGQMNGISRLGNGFEMKTDEDFSGDFICNWMKNGVSTITFNEVNYTGTVTYSDTSVCENWYNLNIDGIDFPSKIQKPKWVKK